jgi:5-deoxy-glucuronate isomerase
MKTIQTLTSETCIIRNTAARKGRTCSVRPDATAARHLHYGRIILDSNDEPISFRTDGFETGLVCLRGEASILVDASRYRLSRFDSIYVPREASVEVEPGPDGCDLAEIAAPVSKRHPVQHVRFSDVQKDPGLHFEAGGPAAKRELNVLLGKNVEAGRIMAGVTFSQPGNWTSWPPHEHAALAEEAYLYIEMPRPSFGVQLVYTNNDEPELATIVHEGDVVIMPEGYHPNVAAPGCTINFLWMMAAIREDIDRQFGVVNVHADFASTGSGLDAGRSGQR